MPETTDQQTQALEQIRELERDLRREGFEDIADALTVFNSPAMASSAPKFLSIIRAVNPPNS